MKAAMMPTNITGTTIFSITTAKIMPTAILSISPMISPGK
jgi:hypothetical protein